MAGQLHLCLNCLRDGAAPVDIGRDKGSQRDPYREHIDLCQPCREALEQGDLNEFHERWVSRRDVQRPAVGGR